MLETNNAAEFINSLIDPEAEVIFGTSFNDSLSDEVIVTVVATGLSSDDMPRIRPIQQNAISEQQQPVNQQPFPGTQPVNQQPQPISQQPLTGGVQPVNPQPQPVNPVPQTQGAVYYNEVQPIAPSNEPKEANLGNIRDSVKGREILDIPDFLKRRK